ncbi:MAG: hypothetical protein KF857_10105 [Fimbriimonadaceae bacterium]|nr:hypothetical protein [Fimbriimonadaceae bacterium]
MDVRSALKGQYHAAFRMLRECVEKCPDDLWLTGVFPRTFWRISYHAAFYGHLYLGQGEASFEPWPKQRDQAANLWVEDAEEIKPYMRADVVEYIDHVRGLVDPTVDALDLDTDDSGFPWYKEITKLEHEILSVGMSKGMSASCPSC